MEKLTPMTPKVLDINLLDQLLALRKAGLVVVHQAPTDSMLKALASAGSKYLNLDVDKGYHRAIAESIRIQNLTRTNPDLIA